jgi:hypothetical protein
MQADTLQMHREFELNNVLSGTFKHGRGQVPSTTEVVTPCFVEVPATNGNQEIGGAFSFLL